MDMNSVNNEYSDVLELEIELTTFCNAKCPLCYRNYVSFPKEYRQLYSRDLSYLMCQLDYYENLNFVMVVGSMSEPTLYAHFIELMLYLKRRQIKVEICTNGDTRDDEFWKQLGMILDYDDSVYFTICGSTQELHSHYRKNTCLSRILHNASVLRAEKPIDYAQCIRFNYNSDNLDSIEFKNIASQFSYIYWTETFYQKDMSNYIEKFNSTDFLPVKCKQKKYDLVKNYAEMKFNSDVQKTAICQSVKYHRQQLDVFGNVYPCYLFLEYCNSAKWDKDYSKILDVKYPCCKFCETTTQQICKQNHLDYII